MLTVRIRSSQLKIPEYLHFLFPFGFDSKQTKSSTADYAQLNIIRFL
jgi:hypothetical protein